MSISRLKLHRLLLILFCLCVVIVGGMSFIVIVVLRGPLVGEMKHDFGDVLIEGNSASFEHTFILTNNTRERVTIKSLRPTCGCTVAQLDREILEPDELVRINTTLSLRGSGRKESKVHVMLDRGGEESIQTLWLKAIGRRVQQLTASKEKVVLKPDQPGALFLRYEQHDTDDPPPDPQVIAPNSIQIKFQGWKLKRKRDRNKSRPDLWEGRFVIDLINITDDELMNNAKLTIQVGTDQIITLPLASSR